LKTESLLPSDIELAKLISKVGDWLLLAVSRLLAIASIGVPGLLWLLAIVPTLRLLLLLLELAIPSETGSEQLWGRSTSCISSCSRVRGTVIRLRLSGGVLSTFRLMLGSSRGQVIDWHGWAELRRLPLRVASCGF
jgi:hypothetical protein